MRRVNYLTTAQNFALETASSVLTDAGFEAMMVGSCLERADWRDVDVRAIMDDADFDREFANPIKLRLLNAALSEWLGARTGLPVDFQFQTRRESARYDERPRNAVGILLAAERARFATTPEPAQP